MAQSLRSFENWYARLANMSLAKQCRYMLIFGTVMSLYCNNKLVNCVLDKCLNRHVGVAERKLKEGSHNWS